MTFQKSRGGDCMAYRELEKLYYGDVEAYKAEYHARFSCEEAVQLNFRIGEHPAFFVQCPDVLATAMRIWKLNGDVARLARRLPKIAKSHYSKKCLIDEIVLTNDIEGVHSSRKEIGDALQILEEQSKERQKHPRFSGLVNRYLKFITSEEIPLRTCEDIRSIYNEVFLEEVISEAPDHAPDGRIFRKGMAVIYGRSGKELHHGLYPEGKIIDAMEQALSFLHDENVEELFRVCIFHYLFEYIHPFYDGNGRMGRFILSYCISNLLEPLLAYRLSETIKENLRQYYKAFEICNDPKNLGDLTPFLIMQLQMIERAILQLKESLEKLIFRLDRYFDLIPKLPGAANSAAMKDIYFILVQATLFSEEGVTAAELGKHIGVSYNTLRKWLGVIPEDMLRVQPKKRVKYYTLNLEELDKMLLA